MKLQKTNKIVRKLISVALSANLLLSVAACKNTTAPSTDTPESSTQSPAEQQQQQVQQPQNQVQQPQSQDDITENPNDTIYKTKITYSAISGEHINGDTCDDGFILMESQKGKKYAIPEKYYDIDHLYIQFLQEETSGNRTIGTFEIRADDGYYIDDSDPDYITARVIE